MKKNSFRFKKNRKAVTALLLCVGLVGSHPWRFLPEKEVME